MAFKHKTSYRLLACILLAIAGTLKTQSQTFIDSSAWLTRFATGKTNPFKIQLTKFCLVKNAGLSKNYTNGWIMKWDVSEKENCNLLFMEMNSTDFVRKVGEGDISGSMQLVLELPSFKDSVVFGKLTHKLKGLHIINNYGGADAQRQYLTGSLKILYSKDGNMISAGINLITKRRNTNQQIVLANNAIPTIDFFEFQKLENERDSLQKKMLDNFAHAITSAVIARDSIWKIENDKIEDSLKLHPYTGKFRFWASQIDKAAFSRITFAVNNDSLIIKEGGYDFIYLAKNYSGDSVYFKKALSKKAKLRLASIAAIPFDSLKNSYDNSCIMDGLIVSFSFEGPGIKKDITVSNYYNEQMAAVIAFINGMSPKKYRIWYDEEELKKEQAACGR